MFVPLSVPATSRPQTVLPKKTIQQKPAIQAKPTIEKKIAVPEIKKPTTFAHTDVKKNESMKQELPKKETPPVVNKMEEVKKVAAVETPKPIQTAETKQPPVAQALDIGQAITPVIPENAHISNNYREVEALRRGTQLQKELVQKWKPPIGVSPECMCEISFLVNRSGVIENLKMAKSSGVIMYDISARQALCAMKMPQWTYGKPLIISFKQ
jgi:outer membrane biosynthesis protein TonB